MASVRESSRRVEADRCASWDDGTESVALATGVEQSGVPSSDEGSDIFEVSRQTDDEQSSRSLFDRTEERECWRLSGSS
jgi:hypothetical protein